VPPGGSAATAVVAAQPAPAAAPASPPAETAAVRPETTTPTAEGSPVRSPAIGVVRPIESPPPSTSEREREREGQPALNEPLDDELFVKEAKARVDADDSSARGNKKKGALSPARPERPRPSSGRPRPSAGDRESGDKATAQPATPKKNTNTLDLFDDTK
jgi:hypothetical protein